MSDFNMFHPGPWFGPKDGMPTVLKGGGLDGEESKLLYVCGRLKDGDFTTRPELEAFIHSCKNAELKRQAIRLYCYVARHEDIGFFGSILEKCNHNDVLTIAIGAPNTLSPEIIPYLFTLLEEYKETELEQDILSSINTLFPFGHNGDPVDIDWLSERFAGFARSLEKGAYYYEGKMAFVGDLTKYLFTSAVDASQRKISFPLANAPSLLSIWSGEKSPVFYGQPVSEKEVENTIAYVKLISSMSWTKGEKYFYGTRLS